MANWENAQWIINGWRLKNRIHYASIGLIILASLATFLTKSGFENDNSAMLISTFMSLFLAPFQSDVSGMTAQSIPFYLMNKNATYLLIGIGCSLCLMACTLAMAHITKYGRHHLSAAVITMTLVLLLINANIFIWNS